MELVITAVYENGVLRPLTPLELPENTPVELAIRAMPSEAVEDDESHRGRVREALIAAGLALHSRVEPTAVQGLLSEVEREALARRLPAGPPLSQIILEEREER